MKKTNKLIGGCILAGAMLVTGCRPLNPAQIGTLNNLTYWGIQNQQQKEMNEAIENSGGTVNVYVGGSQSNEYDNPNSPEKVARRKRAIDKAIAEGRWP